MIARSLRSLPSGQFASVIGWRFGGYLSRPANGLVYRDCSGPDSHGMGWAVAAGDDLAPISALAFLASRKICSLASSGSWSKISMVAPLSGETSWLRHC
jgi:hypothetical protein